MRCSEQHLKYTERKSKSTRSSSLLSHLMHAHTHTRLYYHMSVDFFFAVDVGCGSSELQQLVRLVHYQRGVELAQPQQVAAEHPAETERGGWSERGDQDEYTATL